MSSVSLTNLLTQLRNRTDKQATNRWPDLLLTGFLNDGVRELWDLLIVVNPDPITTSYDWTTDGTSTFALPSDTYAIRGVDLVHSTRDVSTLFPISFSYRNRFKDWLDRPYYTPFYYDRTGDNLIIIPTPSSGKTLTLYYIAYPTTLVSGSDTIDFQNGWEDYVLNSAAAKLAIRDEDQTYQAFVMERQRNEARIRKASRFSGSQPLTVANLKFVRRSR